MSASLLRLSRRVDNPRKPDIQRTVVGRTSCGTYRADISGTCESHWHGRLSEENARMSLLAAYDNTGQGLLIEVRSMSVAP